MTDICIEGYPRSGNTFAVLMFNMANDVHIAHHTHCTGQIARALRYGIPAVVLIRHPIDAITSSAFSLGGQKAIDAQVYRYIAFYRWVKPRVDSVVLCRFETVITDFNRVIGPRQTALVRELLGGFYRVPTDPRTMAPVGLDPRRPWGLVMETDGLTFPLYGFVPVTDLRVLLAS